MTSTYTQLFIHIVFMVKGRENLLPGEYKNTLEKYMTTVLQNNGHKMLAIYCMPDHVHLVIGFNPYVSVAETVLDVKRASANFINQQKWVPGHFNWQKGYGAFSYAKSEQPELIGHILSQASYHQTHTFREEYLALLGLFEIDFEDRYLFEFYD